MDENLSSKIEILAEELKNTNRRLDSLIKNQDSFQNSLNIMDKDRELMEKTHALLREVKELINFFREKQDDTHKEVKAEIHEVKESIDDLPKETEKAVSEGFEGILTVVKQKKNVLLRKPWWRRLFRR